MDDKLYKRRAAYEKRLKGEPVKKVARDLGVSTGFVTKWFDRGVHTEEFHDQERSGRPTKVPAELKSKEKRLLKRKRSGSALKVSKVLKTEHGIDISPRQVERHAKEMGLKSRVRPKKPRLYRGDLSRRVAFAKRRRGKGCWEKVWWSDEKAFVLHNEPRRQWVETMDEVEPRGKDLVEPTIRVWAAVSDQGRTELYKIPSTWTSPEYVDFLKEKGMPDIVKQSGGDFIFEQDGDGVHRGRVVQNYFDDNRIEILPDLPARSPDIPPIENDWANLVRRLESRNVETKSGLWKAMKDEWKKMGQEKNASLAASVNKRLKEIIASEGKATRH
jgi:transposase